MLKRLIALCLIFALLVPAVLAIPDSGEDRLALLEEVKEYLDDYHLYPAEDGAPINVTAQDLAGDPELVRTIINGWLAEDKYGYFMTMEEYNQSFPQETTTVGIGIQVDFSMAQGTYVVGFLEDSDAMKSGMDIGCQIVAVDGVDVRDEPFLEVARPLIAGNIPLSKVTISYINPGSTKVHTETFTRRSLNLPPHVSGGMLDEDTGYIYIEQFGSLNDYYNFNELYNDVLPGMGAEDIIIDVRDNPGGELDTLLNILNCMFADEGALLVRMLYRDENEEFYTTGQDEGLVWEYDDVWVLINENAYSASEVFAGTLKDLGKATVVGVDSGGKSRAQYHVPLESGDMLVFTYSDIQLYATESYFDVGITPDVTVEQEYVSGTELAQGDVGQRAIYKYNRDKERIYALEQRLALLGYFRDTPDGKLDSYTFWCFARFQSAMNRPKTTYIGRNDLALMDALLADMVFLAADTQLEHCLAS